MIFVVRRLLLLISILIVVGSTKLEATDQQILDNIHRGWQRRQRLTDGFICRLSARSLIRDLEDDVQSDANPKKANERKDVSFEWTATWSVDLVGGRVRRETKSYSIASDHERLIPYHERLLFDGTDFWKHTPRRELVSGDEFRRVELSQLDVNKDTHLLFPYEHFPLFLALGYIAPHLTRDKSFRHETLPLEIQTAMSSTDSRSLTVHRKQQIGNSINDIAYELDSEHDFAITRCESRALGTVFGGNRIISTIKYREMSGLWLPTHWTVESKADEELCELDELNVEELILNPEFAPGTFQLQDSNSLLYPGALVAQKGRLKEVDAAGKLLPLGPNAVSPKRNSFPTRSVFVILFIVCNAIVVIAFFVWRTGLGGEWAAGSDGVAVVHVPDAAQRGVICEQSSVFLLHDGATSGSQRLRDERRALGVFVR